jgi:RNA polymerase sigma-70 factor (ECF subfamily)
VDVATQGKSPEAFETLFEPILGLAFGVAQRLARNPADAEDLVQEAALQAFRGFASFEPGTNFKAWYLRILTNCFLMRQRRKKRGPELIDLDSAPPLYLMQKSVASGLYEGSSDPADSLLGKLSTEQIGRAIAALPEEFRVVTTLYFLDDMAYKDIAAVLDLPVGTVRSRLHRGRRMLQKALWQLAVEEGIVQGSRGEKLS